MKPETSELDFAIIVLTYSVWVLGGCLLLVGLFMVIRYRKKIWVSEVKEIFFKDRERPNGKPKITNGKF